MFTRNPIVALFHLAASGPRWELKKVGRGWVVVIFVFSGNHPALLEIGPHTTNVDSL